MADNLEDKFAQRRSGWQWLKEKGNLSRHMAETFSSVFKDQMEILREVDSEIRENAAGLPHYLKEAKKALKQRRYLDVAHFLNRINQDVKVVLNEGNKLKELREDHIDDFYGDYKYFDPNEQIFSKEAGLLDFFDDRQRAAKVLEKIYKNKTKKRNRDMQKLVNDAERAVNNILNRFEIMGDLRASGKISDYISELDKISQIQNKFEESFKEKYFEHIAPMVERMKGESAEVEKIQDELGGTKEEAIEVKEDGDVEEVELDERLEEPGKSKIPRPSRSEKDDDIAKKFEGQEFADEFLSEWGEDVPAPDPSKQELGGGQEPEGQAEEYVAPEQKRPEMSTKQVANASLELASNGFVKEAIKLLIEESTKLEKQGNEKVSTELLILADKIVKG